LVGSQTFQVLKTWKVCGHFNVQSWSIARTTHPPESENTHILETMPRQKFNIFWLYALVITALGLYPSGFP